MEPNLLMCYGILKVGRELDMTKYGAKFIGECHLDGASLFGIGPVWGGANHGRRYHGVGLKLTREGEHDTAHGELFEVPDDLWKWLDDIESNGHVYLRKVVEVEVVDKDGAGVTPVNAWVYIHLYEHFTEEQRLIDGRF